MDNSIESNHITKESKIKAVFIGTGRAREIPALKRIEGHIPLKRILAAISKSTGTPVDTFLKKNFKGGAARPIAMELLYRYGGMKQREIGELMGIDYSAASVGRTRLQKMVDKDETLLELMEQIETSLIQG